MIIVNVTSRNNAETPKTDNGTRVRLLFKTLRSIPTNITTDAMKSIRMPMIKRGDLSSISRFNSEHTFLHMIVFAVSFHSLTWKHQFYPCPIV